MQQKLRVDTSITVETPEGVDFEFQLAGPGKRGLALAIDMALKLIFLFITLRLLSLFGTIVGATGMVTGTALLLVFFVNWLYSGCFEALFNGQTPAKMLMRLRVVRTNGTPIGVYEAFGRNLLLAADFLPIGYAAGLLTMLATRRMQRLGDLVFDTMVVDEKPEAMITHLEFVGPVPALHRSQCSGRFDVPERTLAIIERMFEKNRYIPFDRRENIAELLSLPLQRRLGFQIEAAGGPPHSSAYPHTEFLHRVLVTFADHPDLPQATAALPEITDSHEYLTEVEGADTGVQWLDVQPLDTEPAAQRSPTTDQPRGGTAP